MARGLSCHPGQAPWGLALGSARGGSWRGPCSRMPPCRPSRAPAALRFHLGAPFSLSGKAHPGVPGASRPLVTALCVPLTVAPSQSMTQGPVAHPAGPRRGQEAPGAGRPLFPPAGHTAGAAEAFAGRADLTARSGRGLSRGEGRWHHTTGQAGSCCESSEPRRTSASPSESVRPAPRPGPSPRRGRPHADTTTRRPELRSCVW